MAKSTKRRQVVMTFGERPDMSSPRIRGGKGASLACMQALGLPVPPGFTISTTVARAVMQHDAFPKRFEWQLARGIESLEKATGKKFGDVKNPLLVSVRSGAEVSMPGMMDTILNLGLSNDIHRSMQSADRVFADDCYARFYSMYRSAVGCESVANNPHEQLRGAIRAVISSWGSERAVAYRKKSDIAETLGTAVTVQAMVFGNKGNRSGTGVVFSRDPNTGTPGLFGEFLAGAQGEDVVSGSHTPMPISMMQAWNSELYQELAGYAQKLEMHFDSIVDIEFTIEEGKLWLLQCRPAKLSAEAAATFAVHRVWDKEWNKARAVESLDERQIELLGIRPEFAPEHVERALPLLFAHGIAASPGAAVGNVALTSQEAVAMKARGGRIVLVRDETNPSDLHGMLAADAIVTFRGGATSHAAVVARQLGIPAVVGASYDKDAVAFFLNGGIISVCGTSGRVFPGALATVAEGSTKKEVNIFRKWLRSSMPDPKINFDAVQSQVSVNRILAEVYLLEAMTLAAGNSTLASPIRHMLDRTLVESAELFACYLAIAVYGEVRHAWGNDKVRVGSAQKLKEMENLFFTDGSQDRGDPGILRILRAMPTAGQAAYFKLAADIFSDPGWGKPNEIGYGGYGGPLWAHIADAGFQFLSGKWKHGLFVDRVFDLRHNGRRLFNKHGMVSNLTSEGEEGWLQKQLDYKRDIHPIGDLWQYFVHVLYHLSHKHTGLADDIYLSPELVKLWEKGVDINLWKETTDEGARSTPSALARRQSEGDYA